jgi:shikimate kinase
MIDIAERNSWDRSRNLLLVGPGGAGKSTLGSLLAPLLGCRLVDLDHQFGCRIGNISTFIREEGYEHYKLRNSLLAREITSASLVPTLLVTSSGFLTPDNPPQAIEANRRLLAECYSICLLPSRNLEKSVAIILDRQAQRPFARDRTREEATIRARYPLYEREETLSCFRTRRPATLPRRWRSAWAVILGVNP